MDLTKMTDEQVLDALLAVDADSIPTQTVAIKRLGIPMTLKALQEETIEKLRKRATYKVKTRKGEEDQINEEQFGLSIISAGTVSPNWADAQLIAKYKASGPEQVLKKILLPGEIAKISDIILDLSGYGDDAVGEVKNESTPED